MGDHIMFYLLDNILDLPRHALSRGNEECHGLRVFLNKNEIHMGDTISNAIHTTIQSAYVHITIYSERYAE